MSGDADRWPCPEGPAGHMRHQGQKGKALPGRGNGSGQIPDVGKGLVEFEIQRKPMSGLRRSCPVPNYRLVSCGKYFTLYSKDECKSSGNDND